MIENEKKESIHNLMDHLCSILFVQVNFSIAIPGMMDELGFSKTALGLVGSTLLTSYAIGQFVNGQLGDKFGGRKLITI